MKSKEQKRKEAIERNTKRLKNNFVRAKYQKLGYERTCMAMGIPKTEWYYGEPSVFTQRQTEIISLFQ